MGGAPIETEPNVTPDCRFAREEFPRAAVVLVAMTCHCHDEQPLARESAIIREANWTASKV